MTEIIFNILEINFMFRCLAESPLWNFFLAINLNKGGYNMDKIKFSGSIMSYIS